MTSESTNNPAVNQTASSQIAWPARMMAMVLGTSSIKSAPANGRLRCRACKKCADSVGVVNVVMNTMLMIIKGYLGVAGQSTALVADAIHSAADVVSAIMMLIGLKIAKRPANQNYPYGYGKVEFLVAIAIYTSLILAGVVIFYDAIISIMHKNHPIPSGIAIYGALLSVVVNEMMFRQSICAGNQLKSPSIVAIAWEKRSDALSSVAVLLGIVGAKMGFPILDPLAAILVAFYILKFSIEMLWEAFRGLMDTSLDSEVVDTIRASAEESAQEIEDVVGIGDIRTREIGQNVWVDLEILVNGNSEVTSISKIKEKVRQAIRKGIGRPAEVAIYPKVAPIKTG